MALPHICVPIDLDAFILNQKVCDTTQNPSKPDDQGIAVIAPLTPPNYVNLRLSADQIQHDVLPAIDIHKSRLSTTNPRISTLYQQAFRGTTSKNPNPDPSSVIGVVPSRQGVYLHWSIPRAYRSAVSQAAPPPKVQDDDVPVNDSSNPSPVFPLVPNRWLVVRLLTSWSPKTATPSPVTAWVIESDRLRTIDQLAADENGLPIDLETDVAPFVAWNQDSFNDEDILKSQAERYIGFRTPLANWAEQALSPDQRVGLTIMNSSNPLFADYTPCNANVFSTKDNFFYLDNTGKPSYLESATCDYVVLGWHSDSTVDPLGKTSSDDLRARLTSLFCSPPVAINDKDKLNESRLKDESATRLICHAAKYNVVYSSDLPKKIPANEYARNFTAGVDMEPVSVGTTALDAVLAFFQAHSKDDLNDKLFDKDGAQTAKDIMGIRELLYATEDDYNSRIKAADLVFAHNFARSQGGSIWRYNKRKDSSGPPAEPSLTSSIENTTNDPVNPNSELGQIRAINQSQKLLDAASFKLDQLRWGMFAEWFKYLSDPTSAVDDRLTMYRTRVALLRKQAKALKIVIDKQNFDIATLLQTLHVKKVAGDSYFRRADPTLCIAGIDAGWDPLYLKATPTRFADRLAAPGGQNDRPNIEDCVKLLRADSRFSAATAQLTRALTPVKGPPALTATQVLSNTLTSLLNEASRGYQPSLYIFGHREWSGQPFKPQFVEWEGIYHHIEWSDDNWKIRLSQSALASSNHSQITYVNPTDLSKIDRTSSTGPVLDKRAISGRMLVLPQPSFALSAVVAQVLDGTRSDRLQSPLDTVAGREKLKQDAQSLTFISGELDGLTDALLTMTKGQHVQPNLGGQGQPKIPMQAAISAAADIWMEKSDFEIIDGATGRAPYGTLSEFNKTQKPFKPVQHGQFGKHKWTSRINFS